VLQIIGFGNGQISVRKRSLQHLGSIYIRSIYGSLTTTKYTVPSEVGLTIFKLSAWRKGQEFGTHFSPRGAIESLRELRDI
jgi:hypothetical protein